MNAPVNFPHLLPLPKLAGRLNAALDKLGMNSPIYMTLVPEALPGRPEAIYSLGVLLGMCVPGERPVLSPMFWGFDPCYASELSPTTKNRISGRSALFAAEYGVEGFFWAFMTTLAALGNDRPKVREHGLRTILAEPGDDPLHLLLQASEPANFQPALWMGTDAAGVSLAKLYEEVRGKDAACFNRTNWLGMLPKALRQQYDVAGSFAGHTLLIAWLIEKCLKLP